DYGQTWTKIVNGIPETELTRVIREDPARRGLLYAGTETGIYVSFDDGANWQRLTGELPGAEGQASAAGRTGASSVQGLPVVPIHDLVVKDTDLVVATHGRSFWILDDVTPLRQLADQQRSAQDATGGPQLFRPRDTVRFRQYGRAFRRLEGDF